MAMEFNITLNGNTSPFQDAFVLAQQKVQQLEAQIVKLNAAANKNMAAAVQPVQQAAQGIQNAVKPINDANETVTKSSGNARVAYMMFGGMVQGVSAQIIAGQSPLRVMAIQVPAIAQAVSFLGVSLSKILVPLGLVAVAAGALSFAWYEVTSSQRDAEKATLALGEALKTLPTVLKEINTLSKAGILSPQAVAQYGDYLTGKIPLYKSPSGDLTRSRSETVTVAEQVNMPGAGVSMPTSTGRTVQREIEYQKATLKEVQDWVIKQLSRTGGKTIADSQIEALATLREQQRKIEAEANAGLEKEKAEITLKHEKEREEIRATMVLAGTLLTEKKKADAEEAIRLTYRAQALEIAKKEIEYEDRKKRAAEAEAQKMETTANKLATARKQALTDIKEVEKLRNQIASHSLTGLEREKEIVNQRYDIEKERLIELIDLKRISEEEGATLLAQLELARKNDLDAVSQKPTKKPRNDLLEDRGTFGLVDAFSSDINKDAEKRTDAEQKIRDKRVRAERDMWQNMLTVAKAFGKEGFIAYKVMMTAMATVDTARAAIGAYNSMVGIPYVGPILAVIAAASAVAAGAIQIANINSASYQVGGYTGDGPDGEAAGTVHRGEVVIPAPRVRQFGRRFTEGLARGAIDIASLQVAAPVPITSQNTYAAQAVRRGIAGGSSSGSPSQSEAVAPVIHINSFTDREAMTNHIRDNPDVHHIIMDEVTKNAHRFMPKR